jgi:hypothetical protein
MTSESVILGSSVRYFEKSVDVVPQSLILLLPTALKVSRILGVHVCSLGIPPKNPDQVFPVMDLGMWEVFKPCTSRVE